MLKETTSVLGTGAVAVVLIPHVVPLACAAALGAAALYGVQKLRGNAEVKTELTDAKDAICKAASEAHDRVIAIFAKKPVIEVEAK